MTVVLASRDPGPGAVDVSRQARPRLALASDDVTAPVARDSVDAWFRGAHVIVSGQAVDGRSSVTANGLGGYDLVIAPGEALVADEVCVLRVTADDTLSSSPLDESWQFTTVEDLGPRVNHALSSPAPGSNPPTSPATVTVFVSQALVNDDDFTVTGASVEYAPPPPIGPLPAPANQVWFDPVGPNAGLSFRGLEGRRILAAGQWRTVTSVQADNIATYDGAQILGTSVTVTVYRRAGLDVVVAGTRVLETGQDTGSGWAPVVTTPAGGVQVVVTPPGPWDVGDRVPVFVRAGDSDGDVSELSYDFVIGQAQGPVVDNIVPSPGTRGLPLGPGVASDLAFRVSGAGGVALASITVLVDGAVAVTAGVGIGVYAASTLTPVSGGYDVVLKRSTAYVDARIVHVDVSCTDTSTRPGERRVWSVQYGTAVAAVAGTQSGGEIPGDDVVRVTAYDLSQSSFCRPAELRHTGYAADGHWYQDGSRTEAVATWFTELGAFPASGQAVVTGTGGWALLPTLAAGPWMQCQQLVGSGWNMAGNASSPLADGCFSPRHARLALASALGVVIVDFAGDRALLLDVSGRMAGAWGIDQRAVNQASGDVDGTPALAAGACQRLALDDEVLVVCQAGALTVVQGDQARSTAYTGSWVRARLDDDGVFAVAYDDGGQGAVEVWTLDSFASGAGMSELYDDLSTPALPAAPVADIDIRGPGLFVASAGEVTVVNRPGATATSLSAAALGLAGAGSVCAVSALADASADYGYVYVGADSPGRVVRFRIHWPGEPGRTVTVSDGTVVSSLSAFGAVDDNGTAFLRSSMAIAP